MADNVERVGLVFKEDGSADFIKSLKLVNSTLKENYENFKLTQAQWDKTTTTTQKLKDKLVYLNDAYDIQSSKVDVLRSELEELENAENRNEVAISKKRAQLTQAEASLQRYQNQINEVNIKLSTGSEKIKEYGKNLENAGNIINKAGNKVSAFSVASLTALTAATKGAINFESAFTGVEKTVDATDEELAQLKKDIRQMAKEIPASTTEISAVAEAAGQLGIKTKDIMNFTRTMIDLGNSTNLSAEEAASSLAKFANVTKMSADEYSNLGSTIVALGNNFETTEKDIVEMATRLAATGELTGLTQSQILALATSMSSVGIEAEAGGSAMSKLLKQIQVATETGSKKLDKFAKVAGMTSEEFKKAFQKDSVKALSLFIKGLNDTERNGKSAIAILDDMGLTEVRLSNTILSLANSNDLMNDAVELANKSWKENNALNQEASKRYETLESKITTSISKLKDIGITVGEKVMPIVEKFINKLDDWSKKFESLNDEQVETIVKIGALVAAAGPALKIIGNITSGIGKLITTFGNLKEHLGMISLEAGGTGTALDGLLTIISRFTSAPVGISLLSGIIAGFALEVNKAKEEVKNDFEVMGDSATNFITGISQAESHLSAFNSTLFASTEEQQNLKSNMDAIQKGITSICKTASDERRGYTQEEITQLDEYFTKLRELKDREIQIQSEIATAITQQATTNAESFQGSLEEYKIESQEWINTALQQKEATLKLIEDGTIEEIALLNQRFKTEEEKQSEAYQSEYNSIMDQKQIKINAANDEVAKVVEAYSNGYTQRGLMESSFLDTLKNYQEEQEEMTEKHNKKIEQIGNGELWYVTNKFQAIQTENEAYERNQKETWEKMYKNMSDSQAKQLGVWLAMQAETELYGGQISEENKKMVKIILDSYDSMPKKTREAMKNAMLPMYEEMQKSEPTLFSKASSIANGILKNLRKAFDIHSPSKKTREIMKYAMQPMEEEMDKGKSELINQAGEIAKGINDEFNKISGNIDVSTSKVGIPFISSATNQVKNDNNMDLIDYDKLYNVFLKALNNCKMIFDRDGFTKFIDNRLMEVM